jgi:NAD(P)-dependent dehydrogenase (short-subunit alcohol dehydrogenase family)
MTIQQPAVDLTRPSPDEKRRFPVFSKRQTTTATVLAQLAIKDGTGLSHHSAAKAKVVGLTKAPAFETASDNVLVNSIPPGPMETPLVDGICESWKAAKREELPLGRFGTPAEAAPTALLLAFHWERPERSRTWHPQHSCWPATPEATSSSGQPPAQTPAT